MLYFIALQEVKSNWLAIKKGLKLVPEESDDVKWVLTLHCLDAVSLFNMKFQVDRSVKIAKDMWKQITSFNNLLFLHQIPWIVKKVLPKHKESLSNLATEAPFEIPFV